MYHEKKNWELQFFQEKFGPKALEDADPATKGNPFHSLFDFASNAGHYMYAVVFVVALIVSVIMFLIYFMNLASSGSKDRDMVKQRMMRGVLVVAFIFAAGAFITLIFGAFFAMDPTG